VTAPPDLYTAKILASYPAITQRGTVKPTHVLQMFEDVAAGWWRDVAGTDRWSYFARHEVRVLVRYVAVHTPAVRVTPGTPLGAELAVVLGPDPRHGRYGGHDELTVRAPDDTVVARWTSQWYWLDWRTDGAPTPRNQPPPDLPVPPTPLPQLPARPRGGDSTVLSEFIFTERETDLNNHVFFVAYLERGENTLADAGVTTGQFDTCRCWYLRPAQAGWSIVPAVDATADRCAIELRLASGGPPAAVLEYATAGF
jgi:hypothetical protein